MPKMLSHYAIYQTMYVISHIVAIHLCLLQTRFKYIYQLNSYNVILINKDVHYERKKTAKSKIG